MVWEFGLQGAVNKWVSIKKKDGYVRRSGSSSELDKSGRGHEGSAPNEHDADQNIKQSSSYKTKSKLRHKTRLRSSSKGSNSIESSAEELSSVNNSIQNGVSSHADSGKMVQEHKIDLPVSKQTFDEKHTNTSHHNRLDRAISQSDLLKRDAILPTNLRLQRPRSLGSTRHPQPPGFRGMDSSMHSVNSNLSVGSAGSALSGSIRSNHSIGSGSLSLQQINAMPWVNEGYDRAMKKREARYLKHNLPQPISNGGRSRDSSIGSTSDKQVSIRKNRLLNHMRDHYPQEYKHYNQSASSRQFAGKVPHSVVQSPTRTHYNDHTSSRSSHKLSPSNTPPLSMTLPLTEFTDDFDAKSGNDCKKCTKLVSKLQILEEELNYLKSYANDLESCDYCKSTSKSTQNFGGSSNEELQESASLKKASQRLSDATYRHKRQIEQMSRDRARWQNDMHLKLSKFSLICKDLNEDSAIVKEDLSNTRAEMFSLKIERNMLASQSESTKSIMKELQALTLENVDLRETLQNIKTKESEGIMSAIKERDLLILELTGKLAAATDLLKLLNSKSETSVEKSQIASKVQ